MNSHYFLNVNLIRVGRVNSNIDYQKEVSDSVPETPLAEALKQSGLAAPAFSKEALSVLESFEGDTPSIDVISDSPIGNTLCEGYDWHEISVKDTHHFHMNACVMGTEGEAGINLGITNLWLRLNEKPGNITPGYYQISYSWVLEVTDTLYSLEAVEYQEEDEEEPLDEEGWESLCDQIFGEGLCEHTPETIQLLMDTIAKVGTFPVFSVFLESSTDPIEDRSLEDTVYVYIEDTGVPTINPHLVSSVYWDYEMGHAESYCHAVRRLAILLGNRYDRVDITPPEYDRHIYTLLNGAFMFIRYDADHPTPKKDIYTSPVTEWLDEAGHLTPEGFAEYLSSHKVRHIRYNDYVSAYDGATIMRVYSGFDAVNNKKTEFQVEDFTPEGYHDWNAWMDKAVELAGAKVSCANGFEFSWPAKWHDPSDDLGLVPVLLPEAPDTAVFKRHYFIIAYQCEGMEGPFDGRVSPTLQEYVDRWVFQNQPSYPISPVLMLPFNGTGEFMGEWLEKHVNACGGVEDHNDPRYNRLIRSLLEDGMKLDNFAWSSFIMTNLSSHDMREIIMRGFTGETHMKPEVLEQIGKEIGMKGLKNIIILNTLSQEDFML